jgi:two-component system chemotaxis sensor kinase CheA
MHMVRNSMDHGLESPERRAAAGKPAQGSLTLSAFHQGGHIVITIADDGGGLNTGRIRDTAIAQRLISANDDLTPAAIHQLILRPGFSTAETVTEISGRGVGLSALRAEARALGGDVSVEARAGAGTRLRVEVPLEAPPARTSLAA